MDPSSIDFNQSSVLCKFQHHFMVLFDLLRFPVNEECMWCQATLRRFAFRLVFSLGDGGEMPSFLGLVSTQKTIQKVEQNKNPLHST